MSIQYPFLDSYHQARLNCGTPYHYCDAKTFYKLKELKCPTCDTPFTTAEVWKKALGVLQKGMREAMSLRLKVYAIQKKLLEAGQPLESVDSGKDVIDGCMDTIENYLDLFPFRGVAGLEFLANQPYNIENKNHYGYAVPAVGTVQVLEEFISENNLEKKDARIIDYGAGTALWSRLFLENGFDVFSVDCKKTRRFYAFPEDSFIKDLGREIQYVKEYECGLPQDCSKQILFFSWPEDPNCTDYPMYAGRVLEEFRNRNGAFAVYVGKGKGSDTAGPEFFKEMETNWDFSIVDRSKNATVWSSDMYLLKRKDP